MLGKDIIQIKKEDITTFYGSLYGLSKTDTERSQKAFAKLELEYCNFDDTSPFILEEVYTAIKRAPTGKMSGPGKICGDEIKACVEWTAPYLLKRFNRYLEERKSPTRWKDSKLLLLFKKGCRKDAGDYRPLSLTSHVYKIYAGLILPRLNPTLATEIGPYQHGLRKGVSTADAILVVESILEKHTSTEPMLGCCLWIMRKHLTL
uniref:Reverse transcriptase domain-containing protein n=1 Tax=Rhabditophanes sp. KR3021 TaxID=114890 RepID=A0AC35TKN3_9BILA